MPNKDGHDSDGLPGARQLSGRPMVGDALVQSHMDYEQQTGPDRTQQQQQQQQQQQATKRYQTLLPAVESSPPITSCLATGPTRKLPPKRKLVLVACSRCRQKKEKCDGERPSCGRCIAKTADCQYDVDDAKASRTSALKRKCDALQDENERLRELFGLLRQKSKPDALDILVRIRNSENPLVVWKSIKDAELLLRWPPSAASGSRDPKIESMNAEALAGSHVKVRARPWTALAGDGMVSDLVSSFFACTVCFSFIDRECFLADMARGDVEKARYCSPFLVNTMCAFRCYTSVRAKALTAVSGEALITRFANEAKRLLALEHGRSSLATAQGLLLLFMTTVFDGSDRVGMMYRLMSNEMFRQLNLEAKLAVIDGDPLSMDDRRALSKALWGQFIFENMIAYTYLQPSLASPPRIPRAWLDEEQDGRASLEAGPAGNTAFADAGMPPLMVSGALNAASEVSKLLYETMQYNSTYGITPGSAEDLKIRRGLYAAVLDLIASLPAHLRSQSNFTPQTCFLSVLLEEAAIGILRPLRREVVFNQQRDSAGDLLVQHCPAAVDLLDRYVSLWPLEAGYSYTVVCCTNNVALALVPALCDSRVHDAFARACRIVDASARDLPVSTYVLQGIQALAWALDVKIPAAAAGYLESASDALAERELGDLAVALRIPYLDDAGNLASGNGEHVAAQGVELGVLLARWSAMSIAN